MEDIKSIIADNLVKLRRKNGMTQIELAERLNYSDKAVSKWERGESVPDITVLKSIADMFGVTVDYLITAEHENDELESTDDPEVAEQRARRRKRMRVMIAGMSVLLVWLVAVVVFIPIDIAISGAFWHWIVFAYAVPISMLVWLIFNALWFNRRRNYLIISLMVWTLLIATHINVLICGYNVWQIYLLGIPGQLIIILWASIGKRN